MDVHSPDDQPGFTAGMPEHCSVCHRLIKTCQTYYLTLEEEILCVDYTLNAGLIRASDHLALEVRG